MDLTGSEQPAHITENPLTQSLLIEMLTTSKNISAAGSADGLQFATVLFLCFKMVWEVAFSRREALWLFSRLALQSTHS